MTLSLPFTTFLSLWKREPGHSKWAECWSVMLQAKAFRGHLSGSLFSNVSVTSGNKADSEADHKLSYCCFPIFANVVWVRRLRTIAVILCLRFVARLFWATGVTAEQLKRFDPPKSCR